MSTVGESNVREAESAYREELRAWLAENCEPRVADTGFEPLHWMPKGDEQRESHFANQAMHQKLHAAGYIGITLPKEAGGQGGEGWMQRAFREESASWEVGTGFYGSIMAMAAPPLIKFGTPEQIATHVPGLVSGDVSWCQLFSEPGAGSDLAALGCRAERDGDEYVVNGQKVWNSAAMYADMGILLVRTDPDQPKHGGISFLMIDMRQPGVEVRPLVQANGAGHFAEVFFDNARVPVANLVGEENNGWMVARAVLGAEAQMIGGAKSNTVDKLIRLARDRGLDGDPVIRQELADAYARDKILSWMGASIAAAMRNRIKPIDGSVVKLYVTENRRRHGSLATQLLGPASTAVSHEASNWAMEQLHQRFSLSIGGGTDEVHHNNLGERALGLPREPGYDKTQAWKDIPKS